MTIDVLIVTALQDELDAVRELRLDGQGRAGWRQATDRNGLPYYWRDVSTTDSKEPLRVALALADDMGGTATATRAMALVDELNPRCLAMCGICAGRRGAVWLGDVIVAERVFNYDHGKRIVEEPGGSADFRADTRTYNLEPAWKAHARDFAREFAELPLAVPRPSSLEVQQRWLLHDLAAHELDQGPSPAHHPRRALRYPKLEPLFSALRARGLLDAAPGSQRLTEAGRAQVAEDQNTGVDLDALEPPFSVHVAPLATGSAVQQDATLFEQLSARVRSVLGVEMEASALGAVAEQSRRLCIIAKSVSDYADGQKDDRFRAFACHASASFLLAFLRKHLQPQQERTPFTAMRALGTSRQEEFLVQVEQICTLRHPPGTTLRRLLAPPPFGAFLEVTTVEGGLVQVFPVVAVEQPMTEELLESFLGSIHAEYRRRNPAVISTVVSAGLAPAQELVGKAHSRQVRLVSFGEYQGLFDFSEYLKWQTARLEHDPIYPPPLYIEQRGQVLTGGQESLQEDVLKTMRELLESQYSRFALVLGDSGVGKTFLLHELARRMAQEQSVLVPVLIEMRSLQKHLSLKALIAQHFAAANQGRLEPDKFLYMLRAGRIVLLFDGFDELALRVTYDQAIDHFSTLIEAVQGEAKVVVTSRTQHFLTDDQVRRELGDRAAALPGYRLIRLERFRDTQVWSYAQRKLKSDPGADRWIELLRRTHLLKLAETPRMLSFMAELDESALQEASERSGKVTPARLYEILIERWIDFEYNRVNPPGAPPGITRPQLRQGATALAMLLWERTSLDLRELPDSLLAAISAGGQHSLGVEAMRHQMGSGSLLVRDEQGRFSFIHQSVLEWLVADTAAQQIRQGGGAELLALRKMSELMADFFISLARPDAARHWAEGKADSAENDVLRANALLIMRLLQKSHADRGIGAGARLSRNLERSDLRGQNLFEADLRRANLSAADLSGATLARADLTEARLSKATLRRTNLEKAELRGADLSGADLSGARLLGANLRGAKLQGARLHGARLVGARIDFLEGLDLFGAAPPVPTSVTPTLGIASPVRAVAFNPTGELLATAHSGGTVHLWDVESGLALRILEGHTDAVLCLAFSPDGRRLATCCDDGLVVLWNVENARPVQTLVRHKGGVLSVAFSPDGKLLASASHDRTVIVWNLELNEPRHILQKHAGAVRGVAFSPDSKTLASVSDDKTLILWSVEQGKPLQTLQGHGDYVRCVAFSPDSKLLATGSDDKTVILWSVDPDEVRLASTLQGHGDYVRSVAFSPDSRTLASGSDDRSVILWSTKHSRPPQPLQVHSGPVWAVAFSPDGKTLASGSDDKTVIFWNVEQGQPLRTLQGEANSVRSVAFSHSGKVQALGFDNGTILLWSLEHARLLRTLQGPAEAILSLAFSPDEETLASGSPGGTLTLWSMAQDRPLATLQGHRRGVLSLAFSADGALLLSGSDDESVILWSVPETRQLFIGPVDRGGILGVAFSPDGKLAASSSADGTLILWSTNPLKARHTLLGHQSPVRSMAFSPDGKLLASGSDDQKIILWSVEQAALLRSLQRHRGLILSVAFSPDGQTLASGTDGGTLILWNVQQGRVLRTLHGHRGGVRSVVFSPDGSSLASAAHDGTARFWDTATGRHLATFLGHLDGWVAFRPDGCFKSGGNITGVFWHAIGLCRFEPGELDPYLPTRLQLPDRTPLIPVASPAGPAPTQER
jgi:WD40 repeat protein/nucleoside phosphorylase